MEQQQNSKKGLIVLAAIILVVLAGCLIAYIITGDKGIEERFANAVGLSTEPDSGGDAISAFGFNVEGNNLYYLIILAVLIVASFLIYKKFKL